MARRNTRAESTAQFNLTIINLASGRSPQAPTFWEHEQPNEVYFIKTYTKNTLSGTSLRYYVCETYIPRHDNKKTWRVAWDFEYNYRTINALNEYLSNIVKGIEIANRENYMTIVAKVHEMYPNYATTGRID